MATRPRGARRFFRLTVADLDAHARAIIGFAAIVEAVAFVSLLRQLRAARVR